MADRTPTDLLEASIARVWSEHDEAARMAAIDEIYHPDARIYEPERAVTGHRAISEVVAAVLADMPPGFCFEVTAPALGHHDIATARWHGGPPGQVIVSGADVARVVDGRIHEHWFFFDPAS